MTHVTIDHESAYRSDLAAYMKTPRFIDREAWRRRILEIEEWNLFDYERPLSPAHVSQRAPLLRRIIRSIRSMLP